MVRSGVQRTRDAAADAWRADRNHCRAVFRTSSSGLSGCGNPICGVPLGGPASGLIADLAGERVPVLDDIGRGNFPPGAGVGLVLLRNRDSASTLTAVDANLHQPASFPWSAGHSIASLY